MADDSEQLRRMGELDEMVGAVQAAAGRDDVTAARAAAKRAHAIATKLLSVGDRFGDRLCAFQLDKTIAALKELRERIAYQHHAEMHAELIAGLRAVLSAIDVHGERDEPDEVADAVGRLKQIADQLHPLWG